MVPLVSVLNGHPAESAPLVCPEHSVRGEKKGKKINMVFEMGRISMQQPLVPQESREKPHSWATRERSRGWRKVIKQVRKEFKCPVRSKKTAMSFNCVSSGLLDKSMKNYYCLPSYPADHVYF